MFVRLLLLPCCFITARLSVEVFIVMKGFCKVFRVARQEVFVVARLISPPCALVHGQLLTWLPGHRIGSRRPMYDQNHQNIKANKAGSCDSAAR